ncbi:DUF1501 domain-containing protein [Ideonella sp.]|uniref:DUF1501 domain-containing protein n=1 Tax=Ideonella sp. TaxID=1929293 RepID=UPI003BB6C56C
MPHFQLNRRGLLHGSVLLAASAASGAWSTLSFAGPMVGPGNRMVLVILRGGLDGLYAVPAIGEPAFAAARGALAEYPSAPLPIEGPFALHPALSRMHAMYSKGELAVLHAVGLPYHERSHFDAQQVLESGGALPYELKDGWLGRSLSSNGGKGLAVNTAIPLVLRGSKDIDTWVPSRLPDPSADLLQRVARMYESDPALSSALQRARQLRDGGDMAGSGSAEGGFVALCQRAGEFLSLAQGPQVAVLELGGWDSHADQATPGGKTTGNLRQLDQGLSALRDTLSGPSGRQTWERTVIAVVTEFGRTVEINGTRGTDHGNGGAAFVLGGAVKGGRVIADWPGLTKAQRYEGRDLKVTTDLRAVFKGLLVDHLQMDLRTLDRSVFPGTSALKPVSLLRS